MKNLKFLFVALGLFIAFGQTITAQITAPIVNLQTEAKQAPENISICIEINGSELNLSLPYGVDTILHFGPKGDVSSPESGNCSFDLSVQYGCGNVTISVVGCVGCTSVVWSPGGQNSWSIVITTPGTYTATVSDAISGCSSVASVNIGSIPSGNLSFNGTTSNSATCGQSNGSINLSVSGGNPGYNFNWSNGSHFEDLTNVPTGNYTVTMSDQFGCTGVYNGFVPSTGQAPIAGFTHWENGLTANFTNQSQNATSYSWNFGHNNQTSTATNPSYTYPANGNYVVTLTATNACGSHSTQQTVSVFFSNPPTVNISGTPQICAGQSVNLTANATNTFSYAWSVPGQNSATINVTPAWTTTYTVTVTSSTGQTATASYQVNVNPLPAVPVITASVQNETVTLNSSGGYNSYVWTGGGNTQSFTFTPTQSGIYYVTVSNQFGCTNVSGPVPVVKTVCPIVPVNPTANFTVSANSGCSPLAVQFTNNSLNAQTYLWDFGDGVTTNQFSPSHTFSTGTFTVKLTATASNGLTHTVQQTIVVTNCTPNCNMTATTTAMPATCFGCNNGSVWTTVTNGTLPLSYVWSFNGVVNNAWNTSDISNLVSGTYCVTVTDGNNCTSVSCVFVGQPGNNPAPIAQFSQFRTGCGIKYQFMDESLNNPTSWYWEFSGGIPATSTQQFPEVIFTERGDKLVKLTVTNANGSHTKVMVVNVQGITAGTGVLSGGEVPQNSYITFEAPSGEYYSWSNGITVQTTPIWTSTLGPVNLTVTVTDSNGGTQEYCFGVVIVPNVTGTNDPENSLKVKSFPNPTNDFVVIEGLELLTDVTVFNEVGQILNQQKYDGEVNLSSFPAGIYFIAAPGMKTQRVVKQ